MAKVYTSNMLYNGLINLPNIIDYVSTAAEKLQYVVNALESEMIDTSHITEQSAVAIFDAAFSHKTRVLSAGGKIGNYNKIIKALNFILKFNIKDFSALSLAFGYTVNANGQPTKLFSLSGALYDGIIDTPTRLQINGEHIQSLLAQVGTITVQTPFNASNLAFGMNSKFNSTGFAGQISVRTQNTASTSGITLYEDLTLSSSQLLSANFKASDDTTVPRPISSGLDYNSKGIVLSLVDKIKVHSPAQQNIIEYEYSKERKDMSIVPQFYSIRIGSTSDTSGTNSYLKEAWFIGNNTNQSLLDELSKNMG